jgi:hypothetical protein
MLQVIENLHFRVKGIRQDLKLQRQREQELRELSEKINSDIYRYTLLLIFVMVACAGWQLKHLKTFFVTKKLV